MMERLISVVDVNPQFQTNTAANYFDYSPFNVFDNILVVISLLGIYSGQFAELVKECFHGLIDSFDYPFSVAKASQFAFTYREALFLTESKTPTLATCSCIAKFVDEGLV